MTKPVKAIAKNAQKSFSIMDSFVMTLSPFVARKPRCKARPTKKLPKRG
jgi:hypothetical protein